MMVAAGNFFFRFRNALFPLVMAALLVATRPSGVLSTGDTGVVWLAAGAAVALLGEAVRLGTIGFRYIERGGRGGKVYASRLVTGGIFNHVRNPMYVGNLMIVLGIAMFSGSLGTFLFAVPFFLFVYLAITAAEEAYLRRSFGDEYVAYCQRVNRFLPRFQGLGRTLGGMNYEWKRALRKDYGTMMTVALSLIFLPVWRAFFLEGNAAARERLRPALVQFAAAAVVYLALYFLKKAGALADENPESNT
jgi:protein-S-isoprenylcysteine O-methyltransferase Ste14